VRPDPLSAKEAIGTKHLAKFFKLRDFDRRQRTFRRVCHKPYTVVWDRHKGSERRARINLMGTAL